MAKSLLLLKVLQTARGVSLFENQMEIFNKLLPNFRSLSEGEQELLYVKERDSSELNFQFKKSDVLTGSMQGTLLPVCDEPGIYHAKLLDVIQISFFPLS